jgi:protoporphyrinogen oxidase
LTRATEKDMIFEKSSFVGGLCRTIEQGDYKFDLGIHILHDIEKNQPLIEKFNLQRIKRKSQIWYQGKLYDYPYETKSKIKEYPHEFGIITSKYDNIVNNLRVNYGLNGFNEFFYPYYEKFWRTIDNRWDMDASWTSFFPRLNEQIYSDTFLYPKTGGIGEIVKKLAKDKTIVLNAHKLFIQQTLLNNKNVKYSSIPLPELVDLLNIENRYVLDMVKKLKSTKIHIYNISMTEKVTDCHWIYSHDLSVLPYRIAFYDNFNNTMAPNGHTSMSVEICEKHGEVTHTEHLLLDLKKMNLIKGSVNVLNDQIIEYGYNLFDKERESVVYNIKEFLRNEYNIETIGRFGNWDYSWIHDNWGKNG